MLHFLPRIFFNTNNDIKIAIHRNLSNKFRQFIEKINLLRKKVNFQNEDKILEIKFPLLRCDFVDPIDQL